MYRKFFGFTERPFQLVPNPAYLFLAKSHEEALAHLTYAISQGDGFVEITGEIGTGKTTLCRVFLESLSENTEAAYIFNPKLDALQLLKSINDDFGIDSSPGTVKELIDILNRFLLEKKSDNKTVLLIIDEAQNLEPEVLEQLRLLSNLETSTSKLLQIVLAGQPELKEKLESHELRQLGQRITLSCTLKPLNFEETCDYIQHRLRIASALPGLRFSHSARKAVYAFSKGTPRLINIICDRTLLTAFAMNTREITGKTVRAASLELKQNKLKTEGRLTGYAAVAVFIAVIIAAGIFLNKSGPVQAPVAGASPSVQAKPAVPEKKEATAVKKKKAVIEQEPLKEPLFREENYFSLLDVLDGTFSENSRLIAMEEIFHLWKTEADTGGDYSLIEDDLIFFRLIAKQNDMALYRTEGRIPFLLNLNLPSILQFDIPGYEKPLYLVLKGYDRGELFLEAGNGKTVSMRIDQVDIYWTGVSFIPWKNFLGLTGTVPVDAPKESVVTLKMLLKGIGYTDLEINADYDEEAEEAVRDLQQRRGLDADGAVGSLTKMVLYSEARSREIPHIADKTEN